MAGKNLIPNGGSAILASTANTNDIPLNHRMLPMVIPPLLPQEHLAHETTFHGS